METRWGDLQKSDIEFLVSKFHDELPSFFAHCLAAEGDTDSCKTCIYKAGCDKYFEPLAEGLKRFLEIGEV
ncbi:hypothetical protein LCGC14_1300600 [marine sediment metagenome]|uniref:Uncharacterized protein n=1 Tax=marine sediment metagenome TaxID=412755 RepID=A0A0F9NSP3_9ZZZZ